MICKSCGSKNNKENKFCINCGDEIIFRKELNHIHCPQCGTENNKDNKFCISCGNKLFEKGNIVLLKKELKNGKKTPEEYYGKANNRNKKTSKPDFNSLKIFWVATAVIIGAVIIPTSIIPLINQSPPVSAIQTAFKNINPAVEAKTLEIASKFVCSCGTCNQESLEVCKCEKANEEREFIRTSLEKDRNIDDIVIAVANKYGWMKSEFASIYNIDPSRVWKPKEDLISKDLIPANPLLVNSESTPWNTVCPIKGEPVDPAVTTVKYDDRVYGFCCNGCDSEFLTKSR